MQTREINKQYKKTASNESATRKGMSCLGVTGSSTLSFRGQRKEVLDTYIMLQGFSYAYKGFPYVSRQKYSHEESKEGTYLPEGVQTYLSQLLNHTKIFSFDLIYVFN